MIESCVLDKVVIVASWFWMSLEIAIQGRKGKVGCGLSDLTISTGFRIHSKL